VSLCDLACRDPPSLCLGRGGEIANGMVFTFDLLSSLSFWANEDGDAVATTGSADGADGAVATTGSADEADGAVATTGSADGADDAVATTGSTDVDDAVATVGSVDSVAAEAEAEGMAVTSGVIATGIETVAAGIDVEDVEEEDDDASGGIATGIEVEDVEEEDEDASDGSAGETSRFDLVGDAGTAADAFVGEGAVGRSGGTGSAVVFVVCSVFGCSLKFSNASVT